MHSLTLPVRLISAGARARRIRWCWVVLTMCVLAMLDATLAPAVEAWGARCELLVMLVVWVALATEPANSLWVGVASGLLWDLLSSDPVGVHAGVLGLVGWGVGSWSVALRREAWHVQIVLVAAASVVTALTCRLLLFFLLGTRIEFHGMFGNMLGNALYSGAVAPLLFLILERWLRGA